MSGRSPDDSSTMSSAASITSRLRRPRKSIFSSPISSIGFIEYWVTVRYERSPSALAPAPRSSASCSGTMSVSGRSAITTAAAWIEELRTIPSRPLAVSITWRASGSVSYTRRSSGSSLRYSSNVFERPITGSGISLARRSPVP